MIEDLKRSVELPDARWPNQDSKQRRNWWEIFTARLRVDP